jgi:glucose/mannose-6-phosphate isomerase
MAKPDSVTVARQSALNLGLQIAAGWVAAAIRGADLKAVQEVLICGMGGSALGADVIVSALGSQLRKPVSIERSYQLPGWVSRNTAVVCVSYSGNTQETLTCFRAALARRAAVVAVTTGGKLAAAARATKAPLVLIDDAALNPSRQPRLGLGFSIGTLLRLLEKAGALKGAAGLVGDVATQRVAAPSAAAINALARKSLAVVGVQYLAGAAHAVANCINENAKSFSAPFSLPELDHHLLEGLSFPADLRRNLAFVVFAPPVMPRPLANQYRATLQILRRRKFIVVEHHCVGQPLAAALGAVSWGTQLSIQLAAKTKTEPLAVPWVQWLKQKQCG